jgi:hypothetical protein
VRDLTLTQKDKGDNMRHLTRHEYHEAMAKTKAFKAGRGGYILNITSETFLYSLEWGGEVKSSVVEITFGYNENTGPTAHWNFVEGHITYLPQAQEADFLRCYGMAL